MKVALIADAFPPSITSAAIQIRDLSLEFVNQGHDITVFIPDSDLLQPHEISYLNGVCVVRLKACRTKDVGYIKRTFGEFMLSYFMWFNLRNLQIDLEKFDGVVWYSPTIFFGPFVRYIKSKSKCKAYLIIRDIFPEWAFDLGLIRKNIPYFIFKLVAHYQYATADIIGVQAKSNEVFFIDWQRLNTKLEVLHNWLSNNTNSSCSIDISKTKLSNRKIFVYAGNMGIAQSVDVLIDLADQLRAKKNIGFIFVGWGSDLQKIKQDALNRHLDNVLFYDAIDPSEIKGIYQQCHVGLVSLDFRHKIHNIPGKFLSYMQAGLPVLAIVNPGNDLVGLIDKYQVGQSFTKGSIKEIAKLAEFLMAEIDSDLFISARCKKLAKKMFATKNTVKQIVNALLN
jgi:glycosyltransferase involved in cell wall biosynthesis